MSPELYKFIGEVQKKLVDDAESAMVYPKQEPFEHGVQVGRWQGLREALLIVDGILRDVDDQEKLRG